MICIYTGDDCSWCTCSACAVRRNSRRLAERLARDRPKLSEADVEEYTRIHYPHHIAEDYVPGRRGRPMPIPGDAYVAALSHERFHEWFGTQCDDTCPHRRTAPVAIVTRRPSRFERVLRWVARRLAL